jgi:uncharacterized protein YciI
VDAHATLMNVLTDDGFVVLVGPLAGPEQGRVRVLPIVDAESDVQVQRLLADDPWTRSDQLRLVSIEPWQILAGAEPLASALVRSSARGGLADRP